MTEEELAKLRSIIAALQDIHDSVQAGRRIREFAISDIEEEIDALSTLLNQL